MSEIAGSELPAAALPNNLTADELLLRPGPDGVSVAVEPARAGWRYLAFRAVRLGDGQAVQAPGPGREAAVVVLAGGGVRIDAARSPSLQLRGRDSVFTAPPWAAYLPAGSGARVVGRPGRGPRKDARGDR